jgi:hypothetical protein
MRKREKDKKIKRKIDRNRKYETCGATPPVKKC